MINLNTITVITRDGFWSSDSRTFRRDKVKRIKRGAMMDNGAASQCCLEEDMVEVELDNGEIVVGREYPTWAEGE